ncbi:MAG: STAS domain-containing protein [Pirellulales bacterium]|nr:STAS domain-containing protein [Pirellulales bacterium]
MFSVESQGAVDVVRAAGPLTHENAHELSDTIFGGLPGGQPMVVLDMHEIPLVDSAGLEALLDVQQAVQSMGGSMKLATLSPLCQEILRITEVEQHVEAYHDVKTAVGSFVK